LLVVLVGACGSRPAEPVAPPGAASRAKLPVGPPLATPGERMSYRLELGGIDLATYDIAVGDVTTVGAKQALVVQTHAKAKPLVAMLKDIDDVFTSWIDIQTGRPLRWKSEEHENELSEDTDAHFDRRSENEMPVEVTVNGQSPVNERQKLTMPEVWDYNALVIALRAWEAPKGATTEAEVMRGRYLWHVTVTVRGVEQITTDLGDFPALRFDGLSYMLRRDGSRFPDPERNFSLWISNDEGRVPLLNVAQTDHGDIKMTLVEYQPGNGKRLRP
jgi:hypothetical protein